MQPTAIQRLFNVDSFSCPHCPPWSKRPHFPHEGTKASELVPPTPVVSQQSRPEKHPLMSLGSAGHAPYGVVHSWYFIKAC